MIKCLVCIKMAYTLPWDCWSTCKLLWKLGTKCQGTIGSIALLGNNCKLESPRVQPGCCCFSVNACFLTYVEFMLCWTVAVDLDAVACHHWRKPLRCLSCFTEAVRVGSHQVWLVSYNRRRFKHPENANVVCAQWKNLVRAGSCLYTVGRELRRVWPSRYFDSCKRK